MVFPTNSIVQRLYCTYWLKIAPSLRFLKEHGIVCQVFGDRGEENEYRRSVMEGGLWQEDNRMKDLDSALDGMTRVYPIGYWTEEDLFEYAWANGFRFNAVQDKLGYTVCPMCPFHNFDKLEKEYQEVYRQLLSRTGSSDKRELEQALKRRFAAEMFQDY
jgi:3'-phosphoadenosine 5'-phosphosulfate sulfotransferase (PAPS reductase)/FAD synthetase